MIAACFLKSEKHWSCFSEEMDAAHGILRKGRVEENYEDISLKWIHNDFSDAYLSAETTPAYGSSIYSYDVCNNWGVD